MKTDLHYERIDMMETEQVQDLKEDIQELSEDISIRMSGERLELAVQLTILANTRTFSTWIRTGLSSVFAGLSIVSFIVGVDAFHGFVLFIGFLFVFIWIIIYIIAYISYKKSYDILDRDEAESTVPLKFLLFVTSGMSLTAILIAALLIIL